MMPISVEFEWEHFGRKIMWRLFWYVESIAIEIYTTEN